jgi:hypothetical protein
MVLLDPQAAAIEETARASCGLRWSTCDRTSGASKFSPTFDSESIHAVHVWMFDVGGPAMGPSNHGRRNEPLSQDDEDDEYDENPNGILSLLEENARLRRLGIKQSSMILKSVAEQK